MQTIKFQTKKESKDFFEWFSKKLTKHNNSIFDFGGQQWNFDSLPIITENFVIVTLISPNNVAYFEISRDDSSIKVQLYLEDQISQTGYNSLQHNTIISNVVYRVLEKYSKFEFCKEK